MPKLDVQRRVVLSWDVENTSVVSNELIIFHSGDGQKRRFGNEVNAGCPLMKSSPILVRMM